jgi:hypothetical protein
MAINVSAPRIERIAVVCRAGTFSDLDNSQVRQRAPNDQREML